jgi:hypothetical protein
MTTALVMAVAIGGGFCASSFRGVVVAIFVALAFYAVIITIH